MIQKYISESIESTGDMSVYNNKLFTVGNRYRIVKKIGMGSFGTVFSGYDINTGEEVAFKVERQNVRSSSSQLSIENIVYDLVAGEPGFALKHFYGLFTTTGLQTNKVIVLDLLGESVENLFNICHRKFSLKTVLMLAEKTLCLLETLHSKSIIHRDVKPENLMIGRKDRNNIYLVDFGLSRKYKNPKTDEHFPARSTNLKGHTGTVKYSSISTQSGMDQSRRDDLESLGYVLVYLMKGELPWKMQIPSGLNQTQRIEKICELKMRTSVETLCRDLPVEFSCFIKYCRNLSFIETPDYEYLRNNFRLLMRDKNLENDGKFDWLLLHQGRDVYGSGFSSSSTFNSCENNSTLSSIDSLASGVPTTQEAKLK